MLKVSIGLTLSDGLRARSQAGHHIAINEFVSTRVDKKHSALLSLFVRRRKRSVEQMPRVHRLCSHMSPGIAKSGESGGEGGIRPAPPQAREHGPLNKLRIPGEADQRSDVIPIRIPG